MSIMLAIVTIQTQLSLASNIYITLFPLSKYGKARRVDNLYIFRIDD
jgi:hypothetical protein